MKEKETIVKKTPQKKVTKKKVVKAKQDKDDDSNNNLNLNNIDKESLPSFLKEEEEPSLIAEELERYQNQIIEIFEVLESINPLEIDDVEERLKAVKLKLDIQLKLPTLLTSLDGLKNKEAQKHDSVRGKKEISLLESGVLDGISFD